MNKSSTDETLSEAKRLYDLGFAILWLHEKSKRPVKSKWTTGERESWADLKSTYKVGYNVGVRTGTPSHIENRFLACVDVDIKRPEPEILERALSVVRRLLGPAFKLAPGVASGRGGGSRHYYVVTATPFKMLTIEKNDDFEICVYSEGRQMVLPPSVHPVSGKRYKWGRALSKAKDLPLVEFKNLVPQDLSDKKTKPKSNTNRIQNVDFNFTVEDVDIGMVPISDEMREAIENGSGVTDRSGFLLPSSRALLSAGLNENEVLSVLTNTDYYLGQCAFDHAQTKDRARAAQWLHKYTLAKVVNEKDASLVFRDLPEFEGATLSAEEQIEESKILLGDDWRKDLDRGPKGRTLMTLKNLDIILTNEVEGVPFVRDLFANRIIYGADTPWEGKKNEPIQDIDLVLLKRWMADTEFRIEPSTQAVLEATNLVAHRAAVHPVREYLDALKWDGVPRLNTWIRDYCQGQAPEPYLSQVSRKFILALVKRVFEPGCQWDYVLVLEGLQGQYKSSIARALVGDKWFMDNLPDLRDKDAMLNLQGKWLIELPELSSIKRADYSLVKAYIARRQDTVRPHYGRLMADVPRQSVFIGTVNESQYLSDPTGNRRYWPVKVGLCDVAGLKAVKDQLFAEAMVLYRTANEVLMLDRDATLIAEEAQAERVVDDEISQMKEALVDFIEEGHSDFDIDWFKFKAKELFAAGGPWYKWDGKTYAFQNGAAALASLRFDKRFVHGQRVWRVGDESDLVKSVMAKTGCRVGVEGADPPDFDFS